MLLRKHNQIRPHLSSILRRLQTTPPRAVPFSTATRAFQTPAYDNFFNNNRNDRSLFGVNKRFCSETVLEKSRHRCWNCASARPFLVCESCKSVQPVDQDVDYFQIFGLERRFEIEDSSLEGKYKDWQKKLHPDLVHTKSERERDYAAEQSARVIDAYRALRDPLLRAIYIMRLEGVEVDEEKTVSEPELLGEIMEIREAVEDAADSRVLNQIQSQIQEKLNYWSNAFGNAFRSKNYDEALTSIQRMTYYGRVKEEIVKKL